MSNLPLEKGYYAARATSMPIKFGVSKNDNTQVAVEFQILDENFPDEVITWVGVFSDKTTERTIESLQTAGWQGDDLSELADQPGSQVLPAEVSLTIEGEEYDGQMRPKVQWVNKPGGGQFKFKKELGGTDLKAFAAQMKNTVKSVRAAGGAARKSSSGGSGASSGGQRGGSGARGGYSGGYGGGGANRPGDRDDVPPPGDGDW